MERRDFANRTFDEIEVGASATIRHTLTATDVEALALTAGDVEGFHLDARDTADRLSVQAAAAVALLAGLVNRKLPGPGGRIVRSTMRYAGRLHAGDTLTAIVTVTAKEASNHSLRLAVRCTNQHATAVAEGELAVEAPLARIAYSNVATPDVVLRYNDSFSALFERCRSLAPVRCAVVHPCDEASLRGAIEAARLGLLEPVLVGPEARIRNLAIATGINLAATPLVAVEHSHAAAERAVALARSGDVEGLMKGSLHTDELMAAVLSSTNGLRTGRRVSHVFAMDLPSHPRLLFITDAAINIDPDLDVKADICRNAIDLARLLGIETPKVAILSAVETVNPKLPGTIDAAALCKMADRGQITGGVLDGPLAFDNAISADAARTKGIVSPVAGQADILLVPMLETGNMLAKQLQYLAGAEAAGIVVGARVPIALTSRADSVRSRLASAALLKLVAHARRAPAPT
jgi:phosphotransacetylase/acyl dehydratase